MNNTVEIISPIDGSSYAERTFTTAEEAKKLLNKAKKAKTGWENFTVNERATICHKAIDILVQQKESLAEEITWQMGRPIQYSPGEIVGMEQRARYMIDIAEEALADTLIENNKTKRFIRHTPLGVVFTIAPWNYPYLTAINSIIPALMAGNVVLLKHSAQTLLCAERLTSAFKQASIPDGVFQHVHCSHETTNHIVKHKDINFICFTGSTRGGQEIEMATAGLFKGIALELGGKDPAYVREDANLEYSVENIVDGAFFNSGQSCCGIERIYIQENIYGSFVEQFIDKVSQYKLGNPLDPGTTLGPMVNVAAANRIRKQIKQATQTGAQTCIDNNLFYLDDNESAYLAPQVLLNVDHSMSVMNEESFGPVVGIMKVKNDEEAVNLMNDSKYGLTASIWSNDINTSEQLGNKLNTGTVFMNRCDYLDPALAWTGIKQSGRGCALSSLAYKQLSQPRSFHLKNV